MAMGWLQFRGSDESTVSAVSWTPVLPFIPISYLFSTLYYNKFLTLFPFCFKYISQLISVFLTEHWLLQLPPSSLYLCAFTSETFYSLPFLSSASSLLILCINFFFKSLYFSFESLHKYEEIRVCYLSLCYIILSNIWMLWQAELSKTLPFTMLYLQQSALVYLAWFLPQLHLLCSFINLRTTGTFSILLKPLQMESVSM